MKTYFLSTPSYFYRYKTNIHNINNLSKETDKNDTLACWNTSGTQEFTSNEKMSLQCTGKPVISRFPYIFKILAKLVPVYPRLYCYLSVKGRNADSTLGPRL